MSDTTVEQRPANPKAGQWAQRIAAQQRAGLSVKQFCKEQGLTEYSFYAWRCWTENFRSPGTGGSGRIAATLTIR
jgi:hypothetical protein